MESDTEQFESRKREHLQLALEPAHQAFGLTGLERIRLVHEALPDLNFHELRLDSPCLGRIERTPFYVAGMTAGHADAPRLNRTLAIACAERGWAMGVGSQRRELEGGGGKDLDHWRRLREEVPGLFLIANIGISQLVDAPLERIQALTEEMGAQALAIHLNALQEVLQPEGTPRFKGAIQALRRACAELAVPVVIKETGCGFSGETLRRFHGLRLGAIDVSGLGGTHWGRIEGARARPDSVHAAAAMTFGRWGESTAESVERAREMLPSAEIWASGGVRSGLDAAKLIALGAHRVGYAQPALAAALEGLEALKRWMEVQEYELRVALFCTGSATPAELRSSQKAIRVEA
ncbi:MAG: type 2 isopentenyl-diphosphate Delta-isomerase [Oligoflexia bacterium]|nr:type 2 isopentenyl-diphosphate Delta-isomerase [Oligoflexia bacterium]